MFYIMKAKKIDKNNIYIYISKLKVRLLSSKKKYVIFLIESPLKMMKNAFYFILKALFVLTIFKFLSQLFAHVGKISWLERYG